MINPVLVTFISNLPTFRLLTTCIFVFSTTEFLNITDIEVKVMLSESERQVNEREVSIIRRKEKTKREEIEKWKEKERFWKKDGITALLL